MSLAWEGEQEDAEAARRAAADRDAFLATQEGPALVLGNEFSEVRVLKVHGRNGARLMIEAPRSGQWITLDPLELEALTWQNAATFTAMVGQPFGPLVPEAE